MQEDNEGKREVKNGSWSIAIYINASADAEVNVYPQTSIPFPAPGIMYFGSRKGTYGS